MPLQKDNSTKKLKVLFLCTGNSCRSQMAEASSAGIETHGLNPNAVRVMKESGVDITLQKLKKYQGINAHSVRLRCHRMQSRRRTLSGFPKSVKIVHHPFDNPPKLAKAFENEKDQLNCYRRVRDEIKTHVMTLPAYLEKKVKSEKSDVTVQKSSKRKHIERKPIRKRVWQRIRYAR